MLRFLILLFILLLTSCTGISVPIQPSNGDFPPSPTPAIRSPTLPFVPTSTLTPSETPVPPQTETPSPSLTFSQTSTLVSPPGLLLEISGCNTSLDVSHGMGEVTNAYPLIRNHSLTDLRSVCATLTASDENRIHPDKNICIDLLPAAHQVTLKLTVDTGFQMDTSIQVDVSTQEGLTVQVLAPSCLDIGFPGWISSEIGIIQPIP